MAFDWSTLALQTVNFLVLVWLLHRFLYRPVLAAIDRRRSEMTAAGERAAAAEARAASAERDWQRRRAALDAERLDLRRDAEAMAARRGEEVVAAARRQADAVVTEARLALAAERQEAVTALGAHAARVSATLAGRLLQVVAPGLGATPFVALLHTRLAELGPTERAALAAGPLRLELAPALPPPEDLAQWRCRLGALLEDVPMVVTLAPDLIAGARLVSPSAQLAVSWADALAAAQAEMTADAEAG